MELQLWKLESQSEQENLANSLGDRIWDKFSIPKDENLMFLKIAKALYQPPADGENLELTEKQELVIEDILKKCCKPNWRGLVIYIDIIYINVYNKKTNDRIKVPLFRVNSTYETELRNVPNNVYIDHLGRVYKSWINYKDENTWSQAWLCVPAKGYYRTKNNIEVDFLNQETRGKIKEVIDTVASATFFAASVSLAVGTAMTFCPLTALVGAWIVPIATASAVPSALYCGGRSIENLVDRRKHEQSVSLAESEARNSWLTLAASVVALGRVAVSSFCSWFVKTGKAIASSLKNTMRSTIKVSGVTVAGCRGAVYVHKHYL